jgi:hypothetical protein
MGLREDILQLPLDERLYYDEGRNTMSLEKRQSLPC